MKHSFLSLAFAALLVSTPAFAEITEDMSIAPVVDVQAVAPASGEASGIPAGAAGASVKFSNDGANRPVLETLTPDVDGISIDPVAADAVAQQIAASLQQVEHIDESAGLPQFDVKTYPKQIFWLTILFVFLYFVNSKAVLPALTRTIDGRAARVAADIDAAQASRDAAERVRDEYEAAIDAAQAEGKKTFAELQVAIKTDMETQSHNFKNHADAKINALETRLEANKASMMDELNAAAADLTVDIARSIAGVNADDKAAKMAIDSLTTLSKAA